MQTFMLHYLQGLLTPFSLSTKRYQIPFATCQKGSDTACKTQKIRENKRVLHALANSFLQLAKGSLIAFRAIAKGNQIPFRANCMRNLRIACNANNVDNIPLGELNLNF
jgi:hypothetical protein